MKRIIILIQVVFLITHVCSCEVFFYRSGTLGRTKYYEAQAVLCADVPYFWDITYDADRFDEVSILEEDSQGRRLYEYICTSKFHWEQMKVLLICQKTDEDKVYYYEDYCYILTVLEEESSSVEDFTNENVETLKARNDWNKPLNNDKMSSVQYPYDRSVNDVNVDKVKSAFRKYKDLRESLGLFVEDLEKNQDDSQVVIVRVYWHEDCRKEQYIESYIVLFNPQNEGEILACESFPETLECQDLIRNFKNQYVCMQR